MSDRFLTVSQLNNFIKDAVNASFPHPVWVCGEVQGYDRNRSKSHIFFELVEKDPISQDIIARIGLVIFAGRKVHIDQILKKSENAFELKDDIEVKFACKVDFYPPHGVMRMVVESIDPVHTLGKLAQQKQKLIAELKTKGILDKNKELELPLVPLGIGLITADDSAAYNDFISELKLSKLGFKVYFRNCLMQGKKTEADVCSAIDELENIKEIDAIIITRGGGSLADLMCFDSKLIAERIAKCNVPVLSGIGHEINTTITDLAAHSYAKTPTAIAQFLIERINQFVADLDDKLNFICQNAQTIVEDEKVRIKDTALHLQHFMQKYFAEHKDHMIRLLEVLKHRPAQIFKSGKRDLSDKGENLKRSLTGVWSNNKSRLAQLEKIIGIVNPQNTLKRGFSITRNKENKTIRLIREVKSGDILVTQIFDGTFESVKK